MILQTILSAILGAGPAVEQLRAIVRDGSDFGREGGFGMKDYKITRLGIGYIRISKRDWYANGGFANSRCVRVQRGRSWAYFYRAD